MHSADGSAAKKTLKRKKIELKFKIATYNIHRCIGTDGILDPERVGKVIQEIDADVIALQELASEPGTQNDVLQYLANLTGTYPTQGFTLIDKNEGYGNALLSKIPFSKIDRINISVPNREPRGIIKAELNHNGKNLEFFATHLGLSAAERQFQVDHILSLLNQSRADIKILMGDFNEWFIWGKRLRHLKHYFTPISSPRTFPAKFPIFKLDRIWISPAKHLISINRYITSLSRIASDHLPLIVEFSI